MDNWMLDIMRGYSDQQWNEAGLFTLVNYLKEKDIIDFDDFSKFYEEHFNNILKLVVERDKNNEKEIVSKYKTENKEND